MTRIRPLALAGEGFAFDPASGDTFILNPIGRAVVGWLAAGEAQRQIVRTLAVRYPASAAAIERDVDEFVRQLHHLGLAEARS